MEKIEDSNALRSSEEIDKINFSIMEMDVLALDQLLKDSINYEDIGKEKFLKKLKLRFSYYKSQGDTELELNYVMCNGCKSKENVCRFTGNRSGKSFALYFDSKNNEIKDIFHCTWYGEMDFFDSF